MTEYTPDTGTVRSSYTRAMRQAFITSTGEHIEEFDRWLSELIRKEREEAWAEGRTSSDLEYGHIWDGHPVPEGEMCDECNEWGKNPYTKEQP